MNSQSSFNLNGITVTSNFWEGIALNVTRIAGVVRGVRIMFRPECGGMVYRMVASLIKRHYRDCDRVFIIESCINNDYITIDVEDKEDTAILTARTFANLYGKAHIAETNGTSKHWANHSTHRPGNKNLMIV